MFDPRHYLALLEPKPGAFNHARPLQHWDLPDCFGVLRQRLETEHASSGTRDYIKVLRLLEHATVRDLTAAVTKALAIGATGPDGIGLILPHSAEQPVALFSLDGCPHLKAFTIPPPDLDRLTHRCRIIETKGDSYRLHDAKTRARRPAQTTPMDPAPAAS